MDNGPGVVPVETRRGVFGGSEDDFLSSSLGGEFPVGNLKPEKPLNIDCVANDRGSKGISTLGSITCDNNLVREDERAKGMKLLC